MVAVDVVTDGKLLFDMSYDIDTLRANDTGDSTYDNAADVLVVLYLGSCGILTISMLNLIFGNPAKTLIRNVRTSVLMGSRELESKDIPLPIGDFFIFAFTNL